MILRLVNSPCSLRNENETPRPMCYPISPRLVTYLRQLRPTPLLVATLLSTTVAAQVSPNATPDRQAGTREQSSTAAASSTSATDRPKAIALEEFVVTGVFTATSVQEATASISTVTANALADQVPVSAADVLLNVPGVFVNSSLGEIR